MKRAKKAKPKPKRVVLDALYIDPAAVGCSCSRHRVARSLLRELSITEPTTVKFIAELGYWL